MKVVKSPLHSELHIRSVILILPQGKYTNNFSLNKQIVIYKRWQDFKEDKNEASDNRPRGGTRSLTLSLHIRCAPQKYKTFFKSTSNGRWKLLKELLWFAFILVSLSYWKHHIDRDTTPKTVVICFHFSIFVLLETPKRYHGDTLQTLWFAFILVSLSYWKHRAPHVLVQWLSCDLLSF